MRKLLLLAILFFGCIPTSQGQLANLPRKIEKRILEYNADSTFAILKKGKKRALYDIVDNKFAFPYQKQKLIFAANNGSVYRLIDTNKFRYTLTRELTIESDTFMSSYVYDQFVLHELGEGRIHVHNVDSYYSPMSAGSEGGPVPSKNLLRSGLYNRQTDHWEIPPQYMSLEPINNYVIAAFQDSMDHPDNKYTYDIAYDVYHLEKGGYEKVESGVQEFKRIDFTKILQLDSLEMISFNPSDKNIFRTYKNGKSGLLYIGSVNPFQLMKGIFHISELLPAEHDFIYLSDDKEEAIYLGESGNEQWLSYAKMSYDKVLGLKLEKLEKSKRAIFITPGEDKVCVIHEDERDKPIDDKCTVELGTSYVGLELVSDSLLKIVQYSSADKERIKNHEGYDSLDHEGNEIWRLVGLEEKTGLYDFKNKRWIINQLYRDVYYCSSVSVLQSSRIERDEFGRETLITIYDIYDHEGILVETVQEQRDIFNSKEKLQLLYPNQNIEKVSFTDQNDLCCGWIDIINVYKENGLVDIIGFMGGSLQPQFLVTDANYAVFNARGALAMQLNKGLLSVGTPDTNFRVRLQDPKYVKVNFNGESQSLMRINNSGDSVIFNLEDKRGYEPDEVEISWRDSLMIVNDRLRMSYEAEYYDQYGYPYVVNEVYESERSAIFKTIDSEYERLTPYYASIQEIPFGYLVSTAENSGDIVIDEETTEVTFQNAKEKRYILLDNSLNAMQFLDIYDFKNIEVLDFGVKACTDQACLFITEDGKALTSDKWDAFELKGDQVKAVKYTADSKEIETTKLFSFPAK